VASRDSTSVPFVEEYEVRIRVDRIRERRSLATVEFAPQFDEQARLLDGDEFEESLVP